MAFYAWKCAFQLGFSFDKIHVSSGKPKEGEENPLAPHDKHNIEQIQYFNHKIKATMIPEDTPYNRSHVENLLSVLSLPPKARILEVGCGMGRQTFLLAKRGYKVDGLDLVPYLLQKLHEYNKGQYSIRTFCCDVIHHPPEMDKKYDAVVGFFVLHHLDDLHASFSAMARFLKPGGLLGFVEPNPYNPLYYFQILFTPGMTWKGDGGFVRMRSQILFPAMEQAGISPVMRFGFFPRFLANRPGLVNLNSSLARIPLWHFLLPFQIFWGRLEK